MLGVQSRGKDRATPRAFIRDHRALYRVIEAMSSHLVSNQSSHRGRAKLTLGSSRQGKGAFNWTIGLRFCESRRCASCQTGHSTSYNARMRSSWRSWVFRMMPASVGSANAMNDTDIVCRAGGLSVIRSTCLSRRMRTREHTQGYTPSVACRNKQTLDHMHAWTLRTCSVCGFPSQKPRHPGLASMVVFRRLSR